MKTTPTTMTTREGFKVGQCVKLVDLPDSEVYMNTGLREGAFGLIMHINEPGSAGQLITVYFPCINKERHLFSHRFVPWNVALRLVDRESPFWHGCAGLTPPQYGLYAPKETLVLLKDAEELKIADESKFKVGDKVRVTKQLFSKDKPVGFVGKIGIVDCDEYYFENDDLYYEESQLELVINEIEEPTGEVFDRGKREWLEIQADRVIYVGNKTILHYTAPNSGRTGRVVAECHPEDKFDKEIGYKVALLKAFQESIPYTIKRMTESED